MFSVDKICYLPTPTARREGGGVIKKVGEDQETGRKAIVSNDLQSNVIIFNEPNSLLEHKLDSFEMIV